MTEEQLYDKKKKKKKKKKYLLNSKKYKLGNFLVNNLLLLKKIRIYKFFQNIKGHILKKRILKKYCNHSSFKQKINNINYNKKKIAVYTCILGNYDNINIPLVKFNNVDYFLITDKKEKFEEYFGVYNIIELKEDTLSKGNIIANRYAKFHPYDFFRKYDYAIYFDGNVRIVSDIRKYITNILNKTGIAMYIHRERNDIYDEAKVCKLLKRGISKNIDKQMKKYTDEGFPKKYGMNEATIIVSDLKNMTSRVLLDAWFKEFLNSKSFRDQLAWPYVLWKNNFKIEDVGVLGNNIYEDNKIEILKHNG